VADVGAVRIPLLVGVSVVLAVVGNPAHHRALDGHRAERSEGVFERLRHLERAVGEQSVEADGHADGGHEVHHREDCQIPRRHRAVPQQHDRDEKRGERKYHGDDVDPLLQFGHNASIPGVSRYTYAAMRELEKLICSLK
jgi:hypothetical protein